MKQLFPERIKELRLEKSMSQTELACELSVSKGLISLWENGLREPSLSSLVAMATFFGVSIDFIVGLADS